MWHTKNAFSAKCNSGRIAIQWFHIKHYSDYQYTKFQPYTFRVQKFVFLHDTRHNFETQNRKSINFCQHGDLGTRFFFHFRGPPEVLGIWGEWLFIFRELGSTGNYFRGAREQDRNFGDIGSLAKKQKK